MGIYGWRGPPAGAGSNPYNPAIRPRLLRGAALRGSPAMRAAAVLVAGCLVAALCPANASAASADLSLAQNDGAPLGGAVLAAIPVDGRALPPAATAVMDQRERKFVPQILPVQTGSTVRFPNSDSVSHHVYSFSAAKRFALYLTKGKPGKDVVFEQPGVVILGCNLHDWMLGYILVLDTPYFAQTDSAGRATLANLPPGRYRLRVWHPRIADPSPSLEREVTVTGAAGESWTVRLAKPLLPARDQKPGLSAY